MSKRRQNRAISRAKRRMRKTVRSEFTEAVKALEYAMKFCDEHITPHRSTFEYFVWRANARKLIGRLRGRIEHI